MSREGMDCSARPGGRYYPEYDACYRPGDPDVYYGHMAVIEKSVTIPVIKPELKLESVTKIVDNTSKVIKETALIPIALIIGVMIAIYLFLFQRR